MCVASLTLIFTRSVGTLQPTRPLGRVGSKFNWPSEDQCQRSHSKWVFTRGQFWPSGIVVACVCPCVRQSWACLCDNSSQVRAWNTKFGPKNAKYFAQGPYCFGDWLGLTFQVKFYFIEKLCLFASLLHLWNICETCLSNCSTSHMAPHTFSDNYMPKDRVSQ